MLPTLKLKLKSTWNTQICLNTEISYTSQSGVSIHRRYTSLIIPQYLWFVQDYVQDTYRSVHRYPFIHTLYTCIGVYRLWSSFIVFSRVFVIDDANLSVYYEEFRTKIQVFDTVPFVVYFNGETNPDMVVFAYLHVKLSQHDQCA